MWIFLDHNVVSLLVLNCNCCCFFSILETGILPTQNGDNGGDGGGGGGAWIFLLY